MAFISLKKSTFTTGLLGVVLHIGCTEGAMTPAKPASESAGSKTVEIGAPATSADEPSFSVETWTGTWEGNQPAYPMRNSNGEPIKVRGMEAMVKASRFTITVFENGKVLLRQQVDDGRIMDFEGTWKGQIDDSHASDESDASPRLRAIVCDLAAIDTGAYRQYALVVDSDARNVQCIGTSSEPSFVVRFKN
jgi:hypothetical protein